jgi:phage tail-like protein
MDANGLRFWLLADAGHWRSRSHAVWDADCRALRLASERSLPAPADPAAAFAAALSALEAIPRALDPHGTVAHWNVGASAVVTRSHLTDEAITLPLDATPSDLLVGLDGVLYCALRNGIRMHDLRGRWPDVDVPATDFVPWRLAARPGGGVWVLEQASGRLARLTGSPLPLAPFVDHAATVFRPDPENCHPPELTVLDDPDWSSTERAVALAFASDAGLAFLSWVGDGEARLRRFDPRSGRLAAPLELTGARYAYSFDWVDAETIVVRMPARRDAPAFDLAAAGASGRIVPSGDVYPLAAEALEASFAHRLDGPPRYPVRLDEGVRGAEPLHRLSIANLARHGEARNFTAGASHLIDSGSAETVWHRLFAEAHLPARTGFIVWLATTVEATAPDPADANAWQPHCFGEPPMDHEPQAPRAAWERAPSELPHHPGLAPWEQEPGRAGLLSVLIQHSRRQVRSVVGRYLWARVELFGDGRTGPQVAALRAYASRYSYRDHYLPRLYRETVYREDGTGTDRPRATPADFLERMLDNFEGMLTPLEDRIAAAHLLSDPAVMPDEHLDWLGAWIGVAFDPALPCARRRAWLAAAPYLARLHGTKAGLQLALDIASGGGVRRGEIFVLEDFRLRRQLATLLGADLNDEDDPLLPGLVVSGNSVVGDTLTVGDRERTELLALFRADVATAAENADVLAFLDRLANRATVLVHQSLTAQDLGLLRRVVELEAPAHVATQVLTATWPFLVGIASLVGVDTYLGPPRQPRPARVSVSSLGQDFVLGPVSLDPRTAGAASPPRTELPVADAGADRIEPFATSFVLDGSGSRAAPGRSLQSYIWRRLPQF